MIREILGGTYANTAFCIFDPSGEQRLSRAGRSPSQVLVSRRRAAELDESSTNAAVIRQLNQIASRFKPTGDAKDAQLQDFDSFRQALNVASADQRLLVFVNADQEAATVVKPTLQTVLADPEVVGRFHVNFVNAKTDKEWAKSIKGSTSKPGLVVIRSGQFGIDGEVVQHLPLDTKADALKESLLAANKKFASVEQRKRYSTHVQQGRRKRVYFENEIPYGEDRDGDGKADGRARGRGRR